VTQPLCFSRSCSNATGICETNLLGSAPPSCTDQCVNDGDCTDNNFCTTDKCITAGLFKVCQYAPANCNDDDKCTHDVCVDPGIGCQHYPNVDVCNDNVLCTTDVCQSDTCINTEVTCNDGLLCTTDTCDYTLGHCTYEPILCPMSSDNCTLNYCLQGGCNARYICENGVIVDVFTPGIISGIVIAAAVGIGGLAAAGYVLWKILHAAKAVSHGGKVADFAAD